MIRTETQTKKFSFSMFGAILLLAGIGLIVFSGYVVYMNFYPMVYWIKTEGKITGTVSKYDASEKEYYDYDKAEFKDNHGIVREVVSKTAAGKSGFSITREGKVTVYYNPSDSSEAYIFSWANFLGLLMLPFGLFLTFLGWQIQFE